MLDPSLHLRAFFEGQPAPTRHEPPWKIRRGPIQVPSRFDGVVMSVDREGLGASDLLAGYSFARRAAQEKWPRIFGRRLNSTYRPPALDTSRPEERLQGVPGRPAQNMRNELRLPYQRHSTVCHFSLGEAKWRLRTLDVATGRPGWASLGDALDWKTSEKTLCAS